MGWFWVMYIHHRQSTHDNSLYSLKKPPPRRKKSDMQSILDFFPKKESEWESAIVFEAKIEIKKLNSFKRIDSQPCSPHDPAVSLRSKEIKYFYIHIFLLNDIILHMPTYPLTCKPPAGHIPTSSRRYRKMLSWFGSTAK